MGFDQNSAGQPIVNVHKKTTQVNVWMTVGIVLFLAATLFVVLWLRSNHGPDETYRPEQNQSSK